MSTNNMTIASLVNQFRNSNMQTEESLLKTAHAQGIEDAERITKVASYTGDVVGEAACDYIHDYMAASLGFDPEVDFVKTASISDMIDTAVECALIKIAETYSPQSGGANLETSQLAAADQLREAGKAHAVLAVQAANDAAASVATGDPNTAIQSMQTAADNITLAQQAVQTVADPELEAQVTQASQIVSEVAAGIQAQA